MHRRNKDIEKKKDYVNDWYFQQLKSVLTGDRAHHILFSKRLQNNTDKFDPP